MLKITPILEAIRAEPFRPFCLYTADGRSYEVRHREFISRSPTGSVVVVHDEDDGYTGIDVLMVTAIEHLPSGNGKTKPGTKAPRKRPSA